METFVFLLILLVFSIVLNSILSSKIKNQEQKYLSDLHQELYGNKVCPLHAWSYRELDGKMYCKRCKKLAGQDLDSD